MSGDDDDVIIHRVQHQTTTDTKTPVNTSRATLALLLTYLPAIISDSNADALRDNLVTLTA